jgi:hypothetical protein
MASTTNYSWSTPDDTALVKDGAAAIRSLGSAIDTTVFNNASAAIAKTIVDAKGDLIAATAADTVSRLAVGTNGQVLTADSAEATGLKWITTSSGSLTTIATFTGNNTTGTWTVSSIPSTYKHIMIVGQGLQNSTANLREVGFRFNGDTGANYTYGFIRSVGGTVDASGGVVGSSNPAAFAEIPFSTSGNTSLLQFVVTIPNYSGSGYKSYNGQASCGETSRRTYVSSGTWASTAAINSVTIALSGDNYKVGTMTMYGVN